MKVNGESIRYVTLDTLTRALKLQTVDVIKIDVEGNGYSVIVGGLNTIKTYRPIILFEVHNAEERKAIKVLSDLGYHIVRMPGEMYIVFPRDRFANT